MNTLSTRLFSGRADARVKNESSNFLLTSEFISYLRTSMCKQHSVIRSANPDRNNDAHELVKKHFRTVFLLLSFLN